MSLQVIGAGFGRTGTMSLKAAFEELGFGRCYHMWELFDQPEKYIYWERIERGEEMDPEELFGGYKSIVDYPGCVFYKELAAYYPEAKIVLNVRDPEKWWQSSFETTFNARPNFRQILYMLIRMPFSKKLRNTLKVVKMNTRQIYDDFFDGKRNDKAYAISVFHKHVEAVKAHFPDEQVLVYNVKEGWEPLCAFLNVPVPDIPFPYINSRSEFHNYLEKVYKGEQIFPGKD